MIMPVDITFPLWAQSLIIDFPTDNIPQFIEEHDWKLWGNFVAQEVSFAAQGAPGTHGFKEPLAWAMAVYNQMVDFS